MAIQQCPKCTYSMKKVYTDKYIITICIDRRCMYSYKRIKSKENKC